MKLLLVRHGQTALHSQGLMVGWNNDAGLDDTGKDQAGRLAACLAERQANLQIRAIYTSPLARAQQTAAILGARLALPVQTEDGLKDIDLGDWEGKSVEKLLGADLVQRYWSNPVGIRIPNGEEIGEVEARVIPVVERLRAEYPEGCAVVVSHLDIIELILAHYKDGNLAKLRKFGPIQPGAARLFDPATGEIEKVC